MMPKSPLRFFLNCNTTTSIYTLEREGEAWRKDFDCVISALLYAASIIQEETPVTMLDEFGVAILERTVIPNRS